jgi:hypothetical protein
MQKEYESMNEFGFGTVFVSKYSRDFEGKVAHALEDLCDTQADPFWYGWAPEGLYCYWDVETNEVLYIGKAVHMARRFLQHNFLYGETGRPKGSEGKMREIEPYFSTHDQIGFSVLLRDRTLRGSSPSWKENDDGEWKIEKEWIQTNKNAQDDLATMEGRLLRAYKDVKGKPPRWNKYAGKRIPPMTKADSQLVYDTFVLPLAGQISSPYVARYSLVDVPKITGCEYIEEKLNHARNSLPQGSTIEDLMSEMQKYFQILPPQQRFGEECFFGGFLGNLFPLNKYPIQGYLNHKPI